MVKEESDDSESDENDDDDDEEEKENDDDDDDDLDSILDHEDEQISAFIHELQQQNHVDLLSLYHNTEREDRFQQSILDEQQAILDSVMNSSSSSSSDLVYNFINNNSCNDQFFPTFPAVQLVPREIVFINGYPALASRAFGGHEIFERGQNTNNNSTPGFRNGVGFSSASLRWQQQRKVIGCVLNVE